MLRLRVVLRVFVAVERGLAGAVLRAVDARVAPAREDFARVAVDFFAAELLRAVLLRAVDARAVLDFLAVAFLRPPVARFVPPLRDAPDEAELARVAVDPSSPVHLPDITRCAASATASAMIDPSLVALDMTLVAACDALSAASNPASRILRRADGLALIAAAAAARPAASISLLIAALAILSIVSDDLEERFFADFAIA